MNEKDIATIATELAIAIPNAYQELFVSRSIELRASDLFKSEYTPLFFSAADVIEYNRLEREEGAGTECAFPRWWETFVLIGTNGGGDYYTLRLDNEPGVWMIGSDCGDEPTLVAESLTRWVDHLIAKHQAELTRQAEIALRRLPYQPEIAAHREAIAREGGNENANDWLDGSNGHALSRLLDRLPYKISPRKMRLYGIACCRLIPGLDDDEDCAAAIELAQRMTVDEPAEDEINAMRSRMREKLERLEGSFWSATTDESRFLQWGINAVHHLYQDDEDYLKDAPIYPNDPRLSEAYNAVSYALYGMPYGSDVECDLLREVLGNPFLPVEFDTKWRTSEVVALAGRMHHTQNFDEMPALADALAEAGCDDPRVLTHSQRSFGHVRGCWVVDLILEKEPDPSRQDFSWDFECQHPRLESVALKERLESFGTTGSNDRNDDAAVLAFADWLEEQGDVDWAEYVRVRCALDGRPPADDYIDLIEKCFECGTGMQSKIVKFENTYFSGYRFAKDDWWEDETDDMERGLPLIVHAVSPSRDAGPAEQLMQRIQAIVERTPVRGIDFQGHYADQMADILDSPGGKQLRYLAFENQRDANVPTSLVLQALAEAPGTPLIETLSIQYGVCSDNDAIALASAPLDALKRLDMRFGEIDCSAEAAETLMTSQWFTQLRQLICGIGEGCGEVAIRNLSRMPHLHSLAMRQPSQQAIRALTEADEFASLRRLHISGVELSGEVGGALCRMRCPKLMDLCLEDYDMSPASLQEVIASSLFDNLRAVSFACSRLNETILDLLARRPCASQLRILRLSCGSFNSLGDSALANSDAFESLTTLHIKDPYADNAKTDTAKLLRNLRMPNLRHLNLEECDIDDECVAALAGNPSFANLKRLNLNQGYSSESSMSPQAAERMLRSSNLQNLVEIGLHQFDIRNAIEVLADHTVLPNLKTGAIWGCNASGSTQDMMKVERPVVYIGS